MPSRAKKSAARVSPTPLKVFISYSNRDRALLESLVVHLRPLVDDRLIELNYDLTLKAGDEWATELQRVEVIRDETPCLVYELPWLPSASGPVKPKEPMTAGSWQTLTEE